MSLPTSNARRRACAWTAVVLSFAAALALAAPIGAQTPPAIAEGRALTIGIIGAGSMGAPMGLAFAAAGHQVVWASRSPGELMELVQQAAPRASAGYADAAAHFGDVIVLAVPPSAIPGLGEDIGDLLEGKIVVDITNPRVDRDGDITNEWLEMGTGEAMAQYLPGTRFVKAFNTVGPRFFANPVVDGVRVGVPIASDDEEAAEVVADLVRDMGLEPVYAGPLARAKDFDRGSPIWENGAGAAEIRETLGLQ